MTLECLGEGNPTPIITWSRPVIHLTFFLSLSLFLFLFMPGIFGLLASLDPRRSIPSGRGALGSYRWSILQYQGEAIFALSDGDLWRLNKENEGAYRKDIVYFISFLSFPTRSL